MKSTNLEDKLLRVERTVAIYKQNNDLVEEINIDSVPLDTLVNIIPPKEGDPLLYDGYVLTPNQLEKLNIFINYKIRADFDLYFYVLECTGIYNW
jgi:hypothetical protein